MARHFSAASNEYIEFAAGDLASIDGGPSTIVILWRPTTVHSGWLVQAADNTTQMLAVNPYSDGNLWHTIGGTFHATMAYTAGDGWRLDLWTKPNGAGQVRGHTLLLSGGGWSHADYGNSPDSGTTVTKAAVGKSYNAGDFLNADVAAIAIVDANWSDAAIEAGNLETGLSAWETLIGTDPAVMWGFNQSAVSDTVLDLTGSGADQTGRSGTTVTADPPGFSYLLGSAAVLDATLPAITGSLTATSESTGALAGTLPALTGNLAGTSASQGALAGTLPAITGSFAQTVAVSTPQVTATIRVRSLSATAVSA